MQFFNCHTHQSLVKEGVLDLVNQYPKEFDEKIAFYSIGIHPWYIEESSIAAELLVIEEKLQTANCLALGECGLDKRIEVAFELQEKVFEQQLLLAEKHQKPVIIHCVAAFQEVIAIAKKLKISVPLIIHGFSKNTQVAQRLLANGFYLSFGKYLLKNPELESVFQKIPDERFFLETDTLSESIEEVYALAAKYKNKSIIELQATIAANFKNVFQR
ncbi:TatD family hydrolase [Flavobacterium sp. TMP13]|uniref:TatD family hydrolase n=1 Tax=Flavobacterium sp. TMP13 TaxID=3425950 RepID=UPI003D77CB68